jgi:hypothetical protein
MLFEGLVLDWEFPILCAFLLDLCCSGPFFSALRVHARSPLKPLVHTHFVVTRDCFSRSFPLHSQASRHHVIPLLLYRGEAAYPLAHHSMASFPSRGRFFLCSKLFLPIHFSLDINAECFTGDAISLRLPPRGSLIE